MKRHIDKLLKFMLVFVLLVTLLPIKTYATDSTSLTENLIASENSATVFAGKSEMKIQVNKVGVNGTAEIIALDSSDYHEKDPLKGISKTTSEGVWIGEYNCGTVEEITFNRYTSTGKDNLYSKFYIVQDGEILAGPYYASEIDSLKSVSPFEQHTKKGLTLEDSSTIEVAKEFGVSNTVINWDMASMIYKNEDADGNPVGNAYKGNAIEYESNGKLFYFDANYVRAQDELISAYSRAGMNVSLVIITWEKLLTESFPDSLLYLRGNRQTAAFNTSNITGAEYWIAAMEFLGSRYSNKSCLVNKFIIGNEIDYTYDWYLIQPLKDANGKYQKAEFNTFMEEFARTFRLANLAVKKYNSESKVLVSLTHNWAVDCYDSYNCVGENIRYNSYAPKDILDWLLKYEKARGDYDWGIAAHPYPIGTTSSRPTITDPAWSGKNGYPDPITGDWKTSPWITAANLELYQLYFEQPENTYKGEVRSVSLTETSICNSNRNNVSEEQYVKSTYEQAASIAQYYYRAANIECIEDIAYFQLHDQSSNKLGLKEANGTKKPSYNVWKYVDTEKTFNIAGKYLKYISSSATSYRDVMEAVTSGFDWNKNWKESNIIRRVISTGGVTYSISSNKDSYASNESILVTAFGDVSDVVGLYLASDDINDEPIYSFVLEETINNIKCISGNTYDILAYGTISPSRVNDAKLKAGNYKLVLKSSTDEVITKNITITSDYTYGNTNLSITTNKTVYQVGEDIIVTATGNTSCWVGIYKKGDYIKDVQSIYWYYNNDENAGMLSGKPTVIQSTTHNTSSSNPSTRIAAGEYVVYLFDGSGGNEYNAVKSVDITIEKAEVKPLKDIKYVLENETDGFANGTVTITKDVNDPNSMDCIMFWADENGKPLENYTSLAKFKLEDTVTTYNMVTHTIIPEGAKKLIAYSSDGDSLSETYVSVDLPDNCNYIIEDDYNVEFQVMSDIHVTTDSGAKGEAALSNTHFKGMLEDISKNSPNSIGIFIAGDIANSGKETEYLKVLNMYQEALANGATLPKLHISIGNHDWMAGNPNGLFQKYVKVFNSDVDKPENVYYSENVDGYNFVYLGGEGSGLNAYLSDKQLKWFDEQMEAYTNEDPDKPVFVLLHQSIYNTIAGSLSGQGWHGVTNESAFKKVLKKYGQIILMNGHSHWVLDSESNMYKGDFEVPVAFNTSSVSYLWTSYNVISGEFEEGSEGYYVRVYDDKVIYMGRDFVNGVYKASSAYVIERNEIITDKDEYSISLSSKAINLNAHTKNNDEITYQSLDTTIATVTEDGTVIPKQPGEVTIRVSALGTDTTVVAKKDIMIHIGDASVYRVSGATRYETSMKIANELKTVLQLEKIDNIIIANGENYADALSGSYLSYVKNAPILLTNGDNAKEIKAYINANLEDNGTVYILGGVKAVSDKVVEGLEGYTIKRLWGATRYETNIAILKEAGVTSERLIVTTGNNFADGISASATKLPVLLVDTELYGVQKDYLNSLTTDEFVILGGTKAVTTEVEQVFKELGNVTRLVGETRYHTSISVARHFFYKPSKVVVANAEKFPDALCGGVLAANLDAPIILTSDATSSYATYYVEDNLIKRGYVLGGENAIKSSTIKNMFNIEGNLQVVK